MRAGLVILLVAGLLAGCSVVDDAKRRDTPGAAAQQRALTVEDLTGAGVDIVPDGSGGVPPDGKVRLTRSQVDVLLGANGVLGTNLERVVPVPAGVVPISFLAGAWMHLAETPRAKLAAQVMGERDWHRAREIVFPLPVLTLFVLDVVAAMPPPAASTRPAVLDGGATVLPVEHVVPARRDDRCSLGANKIAEAVDTIFKRLGLSQLPKGGGFFKDVVRFFAKVYQTAVDFARGVVNAVVEAITDSVLGHIRRAIGAVTLAIEVATLINGKKLDGRVEPAGQYRFAVGDEPDIKGTAVFSAKDITKDWPAAVRDCAPGGLPDLMAPGSKTRFILRTAEGVATIAGKDGTVGTDRTARVVFTTGRESAEDAKGEAVLDGAQVEAIVTSDAVDQLTKAGLALVRELVDEILDAVPAPVRKVVADIVVAIVKPLVDELSAMLKKGGGGVFGINGSVTAMVLHHRKPVPKPSATPTGDGNDSDFCRHYLEAAQWSRAHQPPPVEPWAAELVKRFTAMRPSAPAVIAADFDTMIAVYRLAAAGASPAVIAGEMASRDFPNAAMRVGRYCDVDPSVFSPGG